MLARGEIKQSLRSALSFEDSGADILFSLLNRLWAACGGLVMLVLIGLFTSPTIQGFYYTFNSLIYLQVFVELGLGIALVQLIGHEMAQLRHTDDGKIAGDEGAKQRLHSLVRFSGTWFTIGSLLLFLLLCTFGTLFFLRFGAHQVPPEQLPGILTSWLLVALGVSLSLIVNAALFVVEGSGKVASAARIRLTQGIVSVSAAAAILAWGGGLFAIATQTLLLPVVGAVALARRHGGMLRDLWGFKSRHPELNWRKEVWPFQSRIAVSWLSGFFALQVFSPLLFAMVDAKAAGQIGMSLQIFTALNGLFIVLVTARTPLLTRLIALRQIDELRMHFRRAFQQSLILLLAALAGLPILLLIGSWFLPALPERIVPWPYLFPLALACLANHVISAEAAFLRAHREERFTLLSSSSGVLVVFSAIALVATLGMAGAVISYSGVTVLFTLPLGTKIFLSQWNKDAR